MWVVRNLLGSILFIVYAGMIQATPTAVTQPAKAVTETVKSEKQKQNKSTITIFQFDNPLHQNILNAPTQAVKKLPDPEVDLLINEMLQAMRKKTGGAGISANQLGRPLQISVVGNPLAFGADSPYTVYINPVITKVSQSTVCFWHGCLSAEGQKFGKVSTWQKITVVARDQKGDKFTRELDKLDAIVFQHEFRHLLGGGYHEHALDFKEEIELMKLALSGKLKLIESCSSGEKPLLDDYQVGETIDEYAERNKKKTSDQKSIKNDAVKQNDRTE